MKILMVNKFFYVKGGSETYYFALKQSLEKLGHTVIDFSMEDKKNFKSDYSEYFVDHIDYSHVNGISGKAKAAKNIIYSKQAKEKFEKLVLATKPDIIHLHIFQHQISPSILDVIKKYNIPTVYTAHDLKMICPNYKMLTHGVICEKCLKGNYVNCIIQKCVKNSSAKSLINVVEAYYHKMHKSYDVIDKIVTPSLFYKKMFVKAGISDNRVIHIANFLDKEVPNVELSDDNQEYYLYFGRISEEKGVMTLINALKDINVKLKVVGTGPLYDEIKKYVSRSKMENVEMLGFKSGQELNDLVANAKAVCLPSEWYENGPYSAIEALRFGVPIIGANIGGIPELIEENGVVFKSGDVNDLKSKIIGFEKMEVDEMLKCRQNSKFIFMKKYTEETHISKLLSVYKTVCESKKTQY